MLEYDFKKRITIEQIKEHAWSKGKTPTNEIVFKKMKKRHAVIEEK